MISAKIMISYKNRSKNMIKIFWTVSIYAGWNQGVETEFLDRDDEFSQFSFVSLDHVCVSSSNLLQLVLQVLDELVLATFYLFYRLGDGTDSLSVDVSSFEHFIQL